MRRDLFPDPAPVHESRLYSLLAAGQQQQQLGELEGRVRHPLDGELGDPAPVHEGARHQPMPDQQKRAHAQHEDFQVGEMDLFFNDMNGKCRKGFWLRHQKRWIQICRVHLIDIVAADLCRKRKDKKGTE